MYSKIFRIGKVTKQKGKLKIFILTIETNFGVLPSTNECGKKNKITRHNDDDDITFIM